MIKKAQIKFISITMTILLFVFLVIFGATDIVLHNSTERRIEKSLSQTVESLLSEESAQQDNGFIAIVSPEITNIVYYDNEFFNEIKILEFIKLIEDKPYSSGRIDNVYYKFTELKNNRLLVASDMSMAIAELDDNILNTFFILLVIYSVLFFVVFVLSFTVFKPVKDSFEKQKHFISNASHELKTPIAVISANADVLKREHDNQWLDNIKAQTERIDALVKDMLTLARLDEGRKKLNFEEFNLSEEIIKNTLPFDALAFENGKTIDVLVEPNLIYKGHAESIKMMMNILLDNAIKYAKVGSEIKITLKKESNRPVLKVFNFGSHVPAEHSQKIFERFYRVENSRSRDSGGSGLGLAIAKSISDANRWKISATSRPNESMLITVIF